MNLLDAIFNGGVLALLGIAMAVILAGAGSAKGVRIVGEAGAGLVTEEPDRFGQTLLLQALPGTQGVYGLLVAFIAMNKIGLIGGSFETFASITITQGLWIFMACMPIAWVGYFSAIWQGQVSAAGVHIIAKRPEELAKGIVYAAMVETYAVLSLLASILLIFGLQI